MATPDELAQQDILCRIDLELAIGELPLRRIFAMPRAITWMQEDLPQLAPDGYHDGALRPTEQAHDLLRAFVIGEDMTIPSTAHGGLKPPRPMRPPNRGIWELRTFDLRFFGWFWRPAIYILAAVDTKERCKKHQLYDGYRDQAVRDRDALNLDSPVFVSGGYDGCFSTR